MIKNIDQLFMSVSDYSGNCVERAQIAKNIFGAEPKAGCMFLWDQEAGYYDTPYDFHVWVKHEGFIYDSYYALNLVMHNYKAQNLSFGWEKPVEHWKTIEVDFNFTNWTPQEVKKAVNPLRSVGIDAIYVNNWSHGKFKDQLNEIISEACQCW